MKISDIEKNRIYSDGKLGLREVIDQGPQYNTYSRTSNDDCLRYRVLNAHSALDVGQESNMTRSSFAAWAKHEIPAEQVERFLIDLQATKILAKLTEPQRVFLQGFDSDLTTTESSECGRAEFRAAVACREKGLIAEMPARLTPDEKYFDVVFTELGLAVLAGVLMPVAVE